ncbi:HAMP domain-containing sensor histidine kinase, partial [Bacteriovoracaceae bacterium]|nr:HAMP domain-containing sensor histidine kinase [Bacteriovoracaceae bacterium]
MKKDLFINKTWAGVCVSFLLVVLVFSTFTFSYLREKNNLTKQIALQVKYHNSDIYNLTNVINSFESNSYIKCTSIYINNRKVMYTESESQSCNYLTSLFLIVVDVETAYGRVKLYSYYLPNLIVTLALTALTFLLVLFLFKYFYLLDKSKNVILSHERYKGKLLKELAHDIRSPLTSLEMMMKRVDEIPASKKKLIFQAIERIQDIANGLLYSSNENDNKANEPIRATIEKIITEKRELIKSSSVHMDISVNYDANIYTVFTELPSNLLKRILSNLMNNSIDALTNKSSGLVQINVNKKENSLEIEITDNGKGIPEHVMDKILKDEPVTFGKEDGNGIGLTHAKEVITKYNGEFALESKEGEGTVVTIKLPLAEMPK